MLIVREWQNAHNFEKSLHSNSYIRHYRLDLFPQGRNQKSLLGGTFVVETINPVPSLKSWNWFPVVLSWTHLDFQTRFSRKITDLTFVMVSI